MLKKINYLLTKRDKKIFIGIFFLILGNAFLDLVSVSSILPVIQLIEKGTTAIDENAVLKIISDLFRITDPKNLCLLCLGLMSLLFVFKCGYMLLSIYVINRFTMSYSRRLTRKLMEAYLLFPYEFHLDNNSSTLIRKSTYDVGLFTNAITDILNFIVKIASAIAIVIFLFIKDWKVTTILFGLMLIFAFVVLKIVKPASKRYGVELQKYNSENYKYLSQAFNGIKESKIGNTESYFTNVYDENRIIINKLTLKRTLINNIPSNVLELIAMLGICLALAVVILIGTDPSEIVITFSVFAYAVIKLLPSVNTITMTINNLHFYSVSVDSLYADIKTAENRDYAEDAGYHVEAMSFNKEICVENVKFFYQSIPDKNVLDGVSVKIEKNTSVAFSGASGAGKTTMIDIILGLLPCREGRVTCDGVDIKENMRGWRTNISYIPQNIFLCDDTVRNNIAFGIAAHKIDDKKIWDALEKAQLKEFVEGLPKGLDTVIGERGVRMSGGQRQRIGIARAFYRDTNIIVFDEATSALDYETEKNILEHVSKYTHNHTMIIITHRLNTIDSCDHIYKVDSGKLEKVK